LNEHQAESFMSKLALLMQSYADKKNLNQLDGVAKTLVDGVYFYRSPLGNKRQPFLYQSGIIAMAQGHKKIYLGGKSVTYGAGDYVVVGVPMPLECEAYTQDDKPILGLSIDVDAQLLHTLVNQLTEGAFSHRHEAELFTPYLKNKEQKEKKLNLGLQSESLNEELDDALARLLKVLHCDRDAKVLGEGIVKEIVYRTLLGRHGHILFDLAQHDGHYARIAKVLNHLHLAYADEIRVEDLAQQVHMSLSGFHRAFREVTSETPLQYLKKIRLSKAKDLINLEGKRASEAALLVGYASPTQFSREFKRYFNSTPRSFA